MKTFPRILALFLSLTLAAPNSALALRDQSPREKKPAILAGLEEALRSGKPDEVLRLASAAMGVPSVSPVPVSIPGNQELPLAAAGAEELREFSRLMGRTEKIMRRQQREGLLRKRIDQITAAEFFNEKGVAFIPARRGKMAVLGDRHGDWATLERELALVKKITGYNPRRNRTSDEPLYLVFVGDYSDIGKKTPAVVTEILRLKVLDPEYVILVSGNHDRSRNHYDSADYLAHPNEPWFFRQIDELAGSPKKGAKIYDQWQRLVLGDPNSGFWGMPNMVVAPNGLVVIHASPPNTTLDAPGYGQKFDTNRGLLGVSGNADILHQLSWNFINRAKAGIDRTATAVVNDKPNFKPVHPWQRLGFWTDYRDFSEWMDSFGGDVLVRGHDSEAPWDWTPYDGRLLTVMGVDWRSPDNGYDPAKKIRARFALFDLSKRYGRIDPAEVVHFAWGTAAGAEEWRSKTDRLGKLVGLLIGVLRQGEQNMATALIRVFELAEPHFRSQGQAKAEEFLKDWSDLLYILAEHREDDPVKMIDWLKERQEDGEFRADLFLRMMIANGAVKRFKQSPEPKTLGAFALVVEQELASAPNDDLKDSIEGFANPMVPGTISRMAEAIQYPHNLAAGAEEVAQVRIGKSSDFPRLREIEKAAKRKRNMAPSVEEDLVPQRLPARLERDLAKHPRFVQSLVATDASDHVLGFVVYYSDDIEDRIIILNYGVDPAAEGKGVLEAIVEVLKKDLKIEDYRHILVYAPPEDKPIFDGLKFRQVQFHSNYFSDSEKDAYEMAYWMPGVAGYSDWGKPEILRHSDGVYIGRFEQALWVLKEILGKGGIREVWLEGREIDSTSPADILTDLGLQLQNGPTARFERSVDVLRISREPGPYVKENPLVPFPSPAVEGSSRDKILSLVMDAWLDMNRVPTAAALAGAISGYLADPVHAPLPPGQGVKDLAAYVWWVVGSRVAERSPEARQALLTYLANLSIVENAGAEQGSGPIQPNELAAVAKSLYEAFSFLWFRDNAAPDFDSFSEFVRKEWYGKEKWKTAGEDLKEVPASKVEYVLRQLPYLLGGTSKPADVGQSDLAWDLFKFEHLTGVFSELWLADEIPSPHLREAIEVQIRDHGDHSSALYSLGWQWEDRNLLVPSESVQRMLNVLVPMASDPQGLEKASIDIARRLGVNLKFLGDKNKLLIWGDTPFDDDRVRSAEREIVRLISEQLNRAVTVKENLYGVLRVWKSLPDPDWKPELTPIEDELGVHISMKVSRKGQSFRFQIEDPDQDKVREAYQRVALLTQDFGGKGFLGIRSTIAFPAAGMEEWHLPGQGLPANTPAVIEQVLRYLQVNWPPNRPFPEEIFHNFLAEGTDPSLSEKQILETLPQEGSLSVLQDLVREHLWKAWIMAEEPTLLPVGLDSISAWTGPNSRRPVLSGIWSEWIVPRFLAVRAKSPEVVEWDPAEAIAFFNHVYDVRSLIEPLPALTKFMELLHRVQDAEQLGDWDGGQEYLKSIASESEDLYVLFALLASPGEPNLEREHFLWFARFLAAQQYLLRQSELHIDQIGYVDIPALRLLPSEAFVPALDQAISETFQGPVPNYLRTNLQLVGPEGAGRYEKAVYNLKAVGFHVLARAISLAVERAKDQYFSTTYPSQAERMRKEAGGLYGLMNRLSYMKDHQDAPIWMENVLKLHAPDAAGAEEFQEEYDAILDLLKSENVGGRMSGASRLEKMLEVPGFVALATQSKNAEKLVSTLLDYLGLDDPRPGNRKMHTRLYNKLRVLEEHSGFLPFLEAPAQRQKIKAIFGESSHDPLIILDQAGLSDPVPPEELLWALKSFGWGEDYRRAVLSVRHWAASSRGNTLAKTEDLTSELVDLLFYKSHNSYARRFALITLVTLARYPAFHKALTGKRNYMRRGLEAGKYRRELSILFREFDVQGVPDAPVKIEAADSIKFLLPEPVERVLRWHGIETMADLSSIPRTYLNRLLRSLYGSGQIALRARIIDQIRRELDQRGLKMPADPASAPPDSIESLGLQYPIWLNLRRNGIRTIPSLVSYTRWEMSSLPAFKLKYSLKAVESVLVRRGLSFFPEMDLRSVRGDGGKVFVDRIAELAPHFQKRIERVNRAYSKRRSIDFTSAIRELIAPLFVRPHALKNRGGHPLSVSARGRTWNATFWIAHSYARSHPYSRPEEFWERMRDPDEVKHFLLDISELAENAITDETEAQETSAGREQSLAERVTVEAGAEEGSWEKLTPDMFPLIEPYDLLRDPGGEPRVVWHITEGKQTQVNFVIGAAITAADVASQEWFYWADQVNPDEGRIPGQRPASDDSDVIERVMEFAQTGFGHYPDLTPAADSVVSQFLQGDLAFPLAVRKLAELLGENQKQLFPEEAGREFLLQAWIAAEYRLPMEIAAALAYFSFEKQGTFEMESLFRLGDTIDQYKPDEGMAYQREWLLPEVAEAILVHTRRLAAQVKVEPAESKTVALLQAVQEAAEHGEWSRLDQQWMIFLPAEFLTVLMLLAVPGPAKIAVDQSAVTEYVRYLLQAVMKTAEGFSFDPEAFKAAAAKSGSAALEKEDAIGDLLANLILKSVKGHSVPVFDSEMVREAFQASLAEVQDSIPKELFQDLRITDPEDPRYRAAMSNLAALGGHLLRRTLTSIRGSAPPETAPQVARLSDALRMSAASYYRQVVSLKIPNYPIWHPELLSGYYPKGWLSAGENGWRMNLDDAVDHLYFKGFASSVIYVRDPNKGILGVPVSNLSPSRVRDMLAPASKDGEIRFERYQWPISDDETRSVLVLGEHAPLPGEEILSGETALQRVRGFLPWNVTGIDAVFLQFDDQATHVRLPAYQPAPAQDPTIQWHFEQYGDIRVVRPVGPIAPTARDAFIRGVGGSAAGAEESIPLNPGVTAKKIIFITPEMASPQLFESLKIFKPAPGEQLSLVIFAEHEFHATEIEKWLAQAGLKALEIVNVKRAIEQHAGWSLFDVVADKQAEYYMGTGGEVHTIWLFEDLRNLGRFLGVAPVHVQLWEKSLQRQFSAQA